MIVPAGLAKNDSKSIFGWAMYDWANSAYITIMGAVIAPLFTGTIVPEEGWNGWSGETIWAWVISGAATLLFLMMPVLGAAADYGSARRIFLLRFAVLGGAFVLVLPFVPDGAVPWFVVIALLANIGFVGANVFYDALLPGLVTKDQMDRVSSKGYAFGYMGGGLYLALAMVLIFLSGDGGASGLSTSAAARIAIFGSGIWWIGFTAYSLRRMPETGSPLQLPGRYAGTPVWRAYASVGFRKTFATVRNLVKFPQLLLFVVAYIFYNDGIQTVIGISGAYAEDTLELSLAVIGLGFLVVQFVAFGGALLFGAMAGRMGSKRAILWSLGVWTLITVYAYFLPAGGVLQFLGVAAVIGVVLGGVQALSRSLYASMIPEESAAEFFGFYTVFSKFSAIWGPLVFALISGSTGSGRPAILAIAAFFLVGGALLSLVDTERAAAHSREWPQPDAG